LINSVPPPPFVCSSGDSSRFTKNLLCRNPSPSVFIRFFFLSHRQSLRLGSCSPLFLSVHLLTPTGFGFVRLVYAFFKYRFLSDTTAIVRFGDWFLSLPHPTPLFSYTWHSVSSPLPPPFFFNLLFPPVFETPFPLYPSRPLDIPVAGKMSPL